jgi:hypothetical protein
MDQIFLYNNASTVVVKGQRTEIWNVECGIKGRKQQRDDEYGIKGGCQLIRYSYLSPFSFLYPFCPLTFLLLPFSSNLYPTS